MSSDNSASIDESEFTSRMSGWRAMIDARLDQLVPSESTEPVRVHSAMRWSLFAGGKRFRPALLLAVGEVFGAGAEQLIDTACAIEMIHTYSLIHDDLPSMDDDDWRRGKPACHVQFDEATAILAGDALQCMAFQTLAEDESLSPSVRLRVISEVARASGTPYGMIAGQMFDLAAESKEIGHVELDRIHRHKTGALITASARCGAVIAGASESDLDAIRRYSSALGLLFQITDDLLDVTASREELGKTPGKDAETMKATYPSIHGLEAASERADVVYSESVDALDSFNRPTAVLRAIAGRVMNRRA